MNENFINIYIERLLLEIQELNKNRFMLETQLKCLEASIDELNVKIKQLELEPKKK